MTTKHLTIFSSEILMKGVMKAILVKGAEDNAEDFVSMARVFPMLAWELLMFEECLKTLPGPNLKTVGTEHKGELDVAPSQEQLLFFDYMHQNFSELREDQTAVVLAASRGQCLLLTSILSSLNDLRDSIRGPDLEEPALEDYAELLASILELIGQTSQMADTKTKNDYFVSQGHLLDLCNRMLLSGMAHRSEHPVKKSGIMKAPKKPYSSMERKGTNDIILKMVRVTSEVTTMEFRLQFQPFYFH